MGKIHDITVTFLEMRSAPTYYPPAPSGQIALMRAFEPPLAFYRYLYDAVGRDYVWVNRKRMSDDELRAIIHDTKIEIYVLYHNGWPAGYAELDFRYEPQVELSFMGLTPDAIGLGLGRYLLTQAISIAWARQPERLIVQTCTLDHPNALPLYQRSGFTPYGQEQTTIEDFDNP